MAANDARLSNAGDVTQLLHQLEQGRTDAFDELIPQIYDELRAIAHNQRRMERPDHTLSSTALVHEAYLKLAGQEKMSWESRAHFFAVAAQAMRRVLISHARKRNAGKRGGGAESLTLERAFGMGTEGRAQHLLELDQALSQLAEVNPRHARVVEWRYFGGLTIEETAHALGLSPVTVTRDWRMARAWLKVELEVSA